MKAKIVLTLLVVILMAMSVSAAVPLAAGSSVQQNAISGDSYNGMSGSANFNSSINAHFQHMHNYGARLMYNTTTGNISGRFLTGNFNSTSGVFSNLTYNLTSTQIISKLYANSTSSLDIRMPYIPLLFQGTNVIGNLFMYTNTSSFFVMHNNPTIETNMLVHNGTIHIYVPSGATIYNTSNMQVSSSANASLNAEANSSVFTNSNVAMHTMVNFNNTVNAGRQMIIIDNNGTIAMLFVHNGSFKITGHEISISSAKTGPVFVNMVVPPGMQKINNNTTVMRGIMKGIVSSEIDLNMVNGTLTNSTLYYNSSIHMVFTGKTSSTATFDVDSSVNHHTIVAIFIGNNVTKNTGHAYVKFDGKIASYVTVSTLMNETSSSHAYYSYVNSSSGMYVLMYIPHFSNHTIEVSDVPFKAVNNYTEYYIAGGVIAILAIIGVAAYAIKKRK
ncbi:MAG: hypothetical protein RE471_00865 [Ferroplasma sp.]|uniref:hypothetical protein n=1 Tax=Ferroplasma sp. TaxID=2591003 RepID=UPI0028167205|nr:hypothetical protein [Ferroplasma sp.]WMT51448.1 MAG: hypothetical protein RE471_00865 [Ferroplasma sp.]